MTEMLRLMAPVAPISQSDEIRVTMLSLYRHFEGRDYEIDKPNSPVPVWEAEWPEHGGCSDQERRGIPGNRDRDKGRQAL